ncbi:MAG TPA: hypothetical protein VJN18_23295 [Polyangiaceae bacterium]|nr:hypothetical protein [Polyangiaceae bacterium]
MARALTGLGAGLLALAGVLFSNRSHAESVTRTFAIVVASNRSLSLALPDLQYADDDGARYQRLFRAAGTAGSVELLTTFDRASGRLYPDLKGIAKAATRSELLRAAARLRQAVQSARAKGERTQLYFVFAGHGEVAGGRGYLHLEDTRIDGTFIEREIIEKIPAETKHVLLDSCNSFFVINPRKPGGRRWATPKDMALGFSARHPEVGLFLSTNSNEEVFEWSELESGVFSHEVRSGLTGAADVNGDGTITYSELAGFVAQANRGIVRENLRPQVYSSGPRGDEQAGLFSTRSLQGRRLILGAKQARIWVRGETGERLVDLHKERGPLSLSLPVGQEELSVFVQTAGASPGLPPTLEEHRVAAGSEAVQLGETPAESPRMAARGDQLFGSLFAMPYGPAAYTVYLKTSRAAPEPVYGVKDEDIQRMGNYITALADLEKEQRRVSAIVNYSLGGFFAAGAVVGQFVEPRIGEVGSIALGGIGAVFVGAGLYDSLTDGPSEKARLTFEEELRAQQGNRGLAFARTEKRLREVARAARKARLLGFWTMEAAGVGLATMTTIDIATHHGRPPLWYALTYGTAGLMSGAGFLILSVETPSERLLRLYRDDPGIKLRAGISALPLGGMGLGVSGSF